MRRVGEWVDRRFRTAWAILWLALIALAWVNRFVQDDAFIVFRYAANFAHGQGLVYNLGERVEGYTCFLYALLVGLGLRLGLEPVRLSFAIGLVALAGSLLATYRLATRLEADRLFGLGAMALLGANYTFSAYATGGLETSLHALLVTAFLALGCDELLLPTRRIGRRLALSLLAALVAMTRLDSVVLIAPMALALLFTGPEHARGARGGPRATLLRALALIVPGGLVLAAWLLWKLRFYGALLPNTFYAKVSPGPAIDGGVKYVYRFIASYWLEAPIVFGLWLARDLFGASRRAALVLIATLVVWTGYVIWIGGDFMEFRLFVPVMPVLAWLWVRIARALERRARLGWALGAVILLGSLAHALVYNREPHLDRIESVRRLRSHLESEDQNWIGIGHVLNREFGADTSFAIATTAAGAIPYYSGLRAVDMLGLADRWIGRHGPIASDVPGHRRSATLDYLIERRVNLVIGHPMMVWDSTHGPVGPRDVPASPYLAGAASGFAVPPGARAVEIPIDRGYRLRALELVPNVTLDRAVRTRHWITHAIIGRP